MPPGKSVPANKDTFFECQKMTIAEIFVKKAKKRGFSPKMRGMENLQGHFATIPGASHDIQKY